MREGRPCFKLLQVIHERRVWTLNWWFAFKEAFGLAYASIADLSQSQRILFLLKSRKLFYIMGFLFLSLVLLKSVLLNSANSKDGLLIPIRMSHLVVSWTFYILLIVRFWNHTRISELESSWCCSVCLKTAPGFVGTCSWMKTNFSFKDHWGRPILLSEKCKLILQLIRTLQTLKLLVLLNHILNASKVV